MTDTAQATNEVTQEPKKGPAAKILGTTRWVQTAFMGLALFVLWLSDKLITIIWTVFAEPDPNLVMLASIVLAGGTSLALYRNPKVNRITHDVVSELTLVTWPSSRETQASTVVVIIASIVAAAIIGVFDAAWSTITDLIY